MHGIDRDVADGEVFVEILVRAHIAAARFQAHLDIELASFTDRRDVQIAIEHFHIRVGLYGAGENFAEFVGGQPHRLHTFADHFERDLLQVEDDVGGVFDDARNGAEFVIHAFDADRGDGRAFDARKEHAAKRVAYGGAETALERLGGELPKTLRQGLGISDQTFGFLKSLEHTFFFYSNNGVALSQSAHTGFYCLLAGLY